VQLGSELAAWRMPVAESHGNSPWLEIARPARTLGRWIAHLAPPCRGRSLGVDAKPPCTPLPRVIRSSRRIVLRCSAAHPWHSIVVAAHQQLQVWFRPTDIAHAQRPPAWKRCALIAAPHTSHSPSAGIDAGTGVLKPVSPASPGRGHRFQGMS